MLKTNNRAPVRIRSVHLNDASVVIMRPILTLETIGLRENHAQ
jgi:hypothetical protein